MERDRSAVRPVIGWLLGALVAFCSLLPVTTGPINSTTAASGAATLVRSSTSSHIEAVAAPLRPDLAQSTHHFSAATPAERPHSINLGSSTAIAARSTAGNCTSPSLSPARAPPSVRA